MFMLSALRQLHDHRHAMMVHFTAEKPCDTGITPEQAASGLETVLAGLTETVHRYQVFESKLYRLVKIISVTDQFRLTIDRA